MTGKKDSNKRINQGKEILVMSNLEIALSYLKKGISVMPIWSPEMVKSNPERFNKKLRAELKENSESENPLSEEEVSKKVFEGFCKVPFLDTWKEYQKRLPTVQEVMDWFTNDPTANIAIITGRVSGIVVFDVDSQEGIDYAETQGGFPTTVRVKTGKGFHYYMKHPGTGHIKNRVNHDLTIDIRADGGYVVAPPSIHGSGTQYQWVEGASIFDLEPAKCTPWMIDYLHKINIETSEKNDKTDPGDSADLFEDESIKQKKQDSTLTWAEILMKERRDGERNQTATQLIGHLFRTKLNEEEIWAIIVNWSQKHKPPMDLDELKRTFESVKAMELEAASKGIEVDSLLDDPEKVVKEYEDNYVRIKFGGTNLTMLEKKMEGGLIGGRLYVLGGIPTSGKTALMNNMADNICLNNTPVLFFSYDDGKADLRYRTFSRMGQVSIKSLNLKSQPRIKDLCNHPQIKKIMGLKYIIEEIIPVEEWEELVEGIRRKTGQLPVIIIDYLRKLRTKKRSQDERLRIDDIVSNLTNLAKIKNVPIIAISELARDSYKSGQYLSMASFKESGMIEYEASWLGILAPVEETKDGFQLKVDWEKIIQHDGNVDLIIFKTKRGTGDTGKIALKVDRKFMTVTDREHELTKQTPKNSKFN
jgi:replicative DNA helicase